MQKNTYGSVSNNKYSEMQIIYTSVYTLWFLTFNILSLVQLLYKTRVYSGSQHVTIWPRIQESIQSFKNFDTKIVHFSIIKFTVTIDITDNTEIIIIKEVYD